MTPDKILTVMNEATDTFGKNAEKPTNNEMLRINQTLLLIILKIPYDHVETTHNLSGLISPSA